MKVRTIVYARSNYREFRDKMAWGRLRKLLRNHTHITSWLIAVGLLWCRVRRRLGYTAHARPATALQTAAAAAPVRVGAATDYRACGDDAVAADRTRAKSGIARWQSRRLAVIANISQHPPPPPGLSGMLRCPYTSPTFSNCYNTTTETKLIAFT